MRDEIKTKEELISELIQLRQRVAELKRLENDCKRAERALRESQERYRNLFDNTILGIFQTTPEGQFVRINPAFASMYGYASPEAMKEQVTNIKTQLYVHPEDRDQIVQLLENDGSIRNLEAKQYRTDSSTFWVSINAHTVRDDEGRIRYFEGTLEDITERKRAEGALRESEERFRTFMDNTPATAWIKDEQGRYVYLNKTFEELHDVRLEDWQGRTDFEVWPFEIAGEFRKSDQAVLAAGQLIQNIEETTKPDGRRSYWWKLKFPIQDASGKRYVGGIGMDITHRKQMEEELLKSRDELELRVRERTAELERANDQLRLIPAKLISVQEEERRRLASELHDSIGQTLAALKFGIETVLVKKERGDSAGAFKLLKRFIPTLQRSIDETRAIYMGLRPTMLDGLGLLATLEWLCREFQSSYPSYHLELETRIEEEEIPEILKLPMYRITQEALNNVVKHSGAQWVHLLVAKNGDSIELFIQDDGEGFDLESILAQDAGRSLGLVGMRERAELTGGRLSIESALDKGTTVRVLWPMEAESTAK